MSQSDSMGGLILTHSQEMALYEDREVGSMMTLLDHHLHPQQPQLYDTIYEEETYQLVEDQKPFQDQLLNSEETTVQIGIMQYPEISDLSPSLVPIPPAVISNEEYGGPFNFEVFIDPHHGTKTPWVFSPMLNKLFITVNNAFPIDFKWDPHPANLYVRATPLYSLAQHVQELVTRCIPHSMSTEGSNINVSPDVLVHVLRCQSRNAHYFGNLEKKLHLNVRVPLGTPQSGMETVRLMYSFVCKNSCPTGMNRKPFEVVFTLEDEAGNVYGRKKLNVRVCSCPKRDKEKEEKDFQKNAASDGAPPPGKKRKADKNDKKPPSFVDAPRDTNEYLVQFSICGKQNKQQILQVAYASMAAELHRHGPNETVQKCLDNLDQQLKHMD